MTDIFLRSVCREDLNSVYRIYSHRQSCLDCGVKPVRTLGQAQCLLEKIMENRDTFAIVLKKDLKTAGFISVSKDIHRYNRRRYMLGYILATEYRGQGIMPVAVKRVLHHAFFNLGADVVSAACFTDNKASQRVLEKCGFVSEGCLRKEFARYDGQVLDSLMYSMLYEEYKELCEE